ncbi:MAG: 2-isopropylmalate synthase [Symbiobacteriaceae bacterium]|jgi:2-isopropylmalate synthase|nr:2-isopropylmalate synthase [Symbiobacteriaceae bacterium]
MKGASFVGTRIYVLDTTLRDGEQSPGFSMTPDEKLRLALQLEKLGVDIIEAGFPASSPSDLQAVQQVAREIKQATVCAFARATKADIDAAFSAIRYAARPRIQTFIATSPIHMEKKLGLKPDEVVRRAAEGVAYAKSFGVEVQFGLEDCMRSDPAFAARVTQAVVDAGATIINVADTVGYATPKEMFDMIRYLMDHVVAPQGVIFSCHCHDDLGMAMANTMAAIEAGCTQVEGTINGIGERAGNAAVEEIAMMLRTRGDYFQYVSGVNSVELFPTSRCLQSITGVGVQPNKAIVGANAFAHEAGIHQDGMLKDRSTYEIMRPQDVGVPETVLVLGKHSGRRALKDKLERMGYQLIDTELDRLFIRFKELADRKKYVTDEDLEAMLLENYQNIGADLFQLVSFQVVSGSGAVPTATVRISLANNNTKQEAASGFGPIEALFKAIDRAIDFTGEVLDFQVRALTIGSSGAAEVSVRVGWRESSAVGRGVSTDLLEACARAYIGAVNRLVLGIQPRLNVAASDGWMESIFRD